MIKLRLNLQELGFNTFERRAVWFLVILLLIGASYRFYRHYTISHQVDLWIESSLKNHDEVGDSSAETITPPTLDNPLDINHAPAAELVLLPGIGPKKAQNIIDYRNEHGPFTGIHELDNVPGIGPKTLQKMKPLIEIRKDR